MWSLPEIGPNDIWIYIYRHKEVRFKDLINTFVKTKKCAKQTFLNYKTELQHQGKIKKRLTKDSRWPIYYVPRSLEGEVKNLIDRLEMKEQLDKLSPEEFKKFKDEFFE